MNLKGWLTTIGLVGLIAFDAILITICFICKSFWWAFFFIGITALVGLFEGLAYCVTGKTISMWFWYWEAESKAMKWWAVSAVIVFLLAMNCLALHLLSPVLAGVV